MGSEKTAARRERVEGMAATLPSCDPLHRENRGDYQEPGRDQVREHGGREDDRKAEGPLEKPCPCFAGQRGERFSCRAPLPYPSGKNRYILKAVRTELIVGELSAMAAEADESNGLLSIPVFAGPGKTPQGNQF